MSNLSALHLHDGEAAHEYLESQLWPHGLVRPRCGGTGRIVRIPINVEKRVRYGLHRCHGCEKQFAVKVGAVFAFPEMALFKRLQPVVLMVSTKEAIGSHQPHHALGITYKTVWPMRHCVREAICSGEMIPLGGNSSIAEADEIHRRNRGQPQSSRQRKRRPCMTRDKRGLAGKRAIDSLASAPLARVHPTPRV